MEARHSEAELLEACAQEPIRTPGMIQPHGMLLAVDEGTLVIEHASENVGDHFSLNGAAAVGQRLSAVFSEQESETLRVAMASRLASPRAALLGVVRGRDGAAFDVLGHQQEGLVILELEPSPGDALHVRQAPYRLNSVVDGLRKAETPEELFAATAMGVRTLTGFDKVMVYRFDEEWNGTVVSEAQEGTMDAFVGHRFPASDIPAQARELYRLNPVRITCDVNAAPVRVTPSTNGKTGKSLDMTYAALRSVSPVHIRYLQNMGVGASMSVSMLRDGKLWGLIACHHRDALYMPHHLRLACQFVGEMFSSQLAEKEAEQERRNRAASQKVLVEIVGGLRPQADVPRALEERCEEFLGLIDADGVAVCLEGRFTCAGKSPEESQVWALTEWLHAQGRAGVFYSDWLPGKYAAAEAFRNVGSGVMAISLSAVRNDYLIWFRAEQVQTVKWAGNPKKVESEDGLRLTPRKSFEAWAEEVGMKSRPWRSSEVEAATALRDRLIDIFMRQAEVAAAGTKDHFMAILSHELRTPLNPVLLAVSALESDGSLKGEAGELVALIRRNVQLQARLIDDLLDVTRISTGKLSLILDVVDLHGVVRHAVEVCGHEAEEKGVALSLKLTATNAYAVADTARMQQVFWNLLKNAIKFTPAGGTIRVTTSNAAEGKLRIEVSDTGAGISEEVLPFIFNAYEQGGRSTTARYGGLGLGLAISHNLVELHHGTISARSAGVGHGATFTVEIPVAVRPEKVMNGGGEGMMGEEGVRLKILLVEDHVETSRVMVKLLKHLSYDVMTTDTVAGAKESSQREAFDLIICDLGLPDGDGVALLGELRKRSYVPAIALSGYGMEADVRRCMEAGFDRHLVKPVDFKRLHETIRQVTAGAVK